MLTECVERVCDLSTSLVLVNNDVIPHTVRRVDANNGNHLQAFLLLELCQHFLGVIKELLGLFAHSLIVEDFGIPSVWVPPPQLPSLEEWVPVDRLKNIVKLKVINDLCSDEVRSEWCILRKTEIQDAGLLPSFLKGQILPVLKVGVELFPQFRVLVLDVLHKIVPVLLVHQALTDGHASAGIQHINHRSTVLRSQFDSSVHFARCCPTNEERDIHLPFLHLLRYSNHLVQ